MSDILARILERKRGEVGERATRAALADVRARALDADHTRGFAAALDARIARGEAAVIAEIKRASPSQGTIREAYDPADIARSYERGGAACLSVLTDVDFFQGGDAHLIAARAACTLPVLRKDFIVDEYQVYEARALGADCLLLIAAALGDAALVDLTARAQDLGMDVLLEVHDAVELERALAIDGVMIGVNNRDLRTFKVELGTTLALRKIVPSSRMLIAESGIRTAADIGRLRAAGVHAFLIGEAFMRTPEPGVALASLLQETSA
ncbi:MAG: indole-3-glycerol phosphate synthase TrpC [Lysobacterales bacterium]